MILSAECFIYGGRRRERRQRRSGGYDACFAVVLTDTTHNDGAADLSIPFQHRRRCVSKVLYEDGVPANGEQVQPWAP